MGCNSSRVSRPHESLEIVESITVVSNEGRLSLDEIRWIVENLESFDISNVVKRISTKESERSLVADILKVIQGVAKTHSSFYRFLEKMESKLSLIQYPANFLVHEENSNIIDKSKKKNKNKKKKKKKKTMINGATLAKLREFMSPDDDLFMELDCQEQKRFHADLQATVAGLRQKKYNVSEKLNSMKFWRKVGNILYLIASNGALICSVVLAAVFGLPVIMVGTTVAVAMVKSLEPLSNSTWDEAERVMEGEKEMLEFISKFGLELHELETMNLLSKKSTNDLDALSNNVEDFLKGEENMATMWLGYIQNKVGHLEVDLNQLKEEVNLRAAEVKRAADEFFKLMIMR